jgi:hypothetical protein
MKRIALVLAALALAGCLARAPIGRFDHDAFYHVRDHYRVRYVGNDRAQGVLPRGWRLDNFALDPEGEPVRALTGLEHRVFYSLAQPGRRRSRMYEVERYDLHFVREGGGEMFARTVPVGASNRDYGLRALMRGSVSPGALMSDSNVLGRESIAGAYVEPLREGWAQVDARNAYFVTFDLRAPSGVAERVTIVGLEARPWNMGRGRLRFPILLVFGYASPPAMHDALRPDFESFVRRVDIRSRAGDVSRPRRARG